MSARHCWRTGCGPMAARSRQHCAGKRWCRSRRASAASMRSNSLPLPRQSLDLIVDRQRRVALGQIQGLHGIGRPRDPRFATHALREANARALIPILDAIFATRDQAEWRRILDEAGLIFGIVADMDEIAEDEQILASEALVPFTDGSWLTVNSPLWIAGQQKLPPHPAPTVGQHSAEILREAGYSTPKSAPCKRPGSSGDVRFRPDLLRHRCRRQLRDSPADNARRGNDGWRRKYGLAQPDWKNAKSSAGVIRRGRAGCWPIGRAQGEGFARA